MTALRRLRHPVLSLALMATVLFLIAFFLLPTGRLLILSVLNRAGEPTMDHYARLFSSPVYVQVLLNTVRISLITAALSTVLGFPVAYFLANARPGLRRVALFLVLLPFWTSFLVRAFGWMILLGRHGAINSTLMWIGFDGPYDLMFNEAAVLVGMVHAMLPIAILAIYGVLDNIDPRLPRVAQTFGARPGSAFWVVYLPLAAPGIAAAALLVFIASLGFFVIPALLGSPSNMMISQVVIFHADEMSDWGFGGAIGVMLLVTSVLIFLLFERLVGAQVLFSDASLSSGTEGRHPPGPGRPRRLLTAIGRISDLFVAALELMLRALPSGQRRAVRHLLGALLPALLIAFLILPILFVIPIAFSRTEFVVWPPVGFTVDWFGEVMRSPIWRSAAWRSVSVAVATATLSVLLALPLAIQLTRHPFRFRGGFMALLMAPMIFPHIIIALGLYYFFARLGIIGTSFALVMGHTLFALPFATLTLLAAFKRYDWRIDQAASVSGAKPLTVMRLITLPLVSAALGSAFLLAFVRSFDELTVALFISGGLTTTLPKQMWTESLTQFTPALTAVSVLFLAFVSTLILAGEGILKARR